MKRIKVNVTAYLLITACLIACLFQMDKIDSYSDEQFAAGFKQTVFNQESGLGSLNVSCITQTASGYIYIGTDGGLYRYNGSEFKIINLWDTEKTDIYCINNLFQDSMGRLWIATDNYGLFYMSGSDIIHFSSEYYDGIKSINDICETEEGTIYVASSDGIYKVEDRSLIRINTEFLSDFNVKDICCIGNTIWGITDGSSIFYLDEEENINITEASAYTSDELSCIEEIDGIIYIGTIGRDVIRMSGFDNYIIMTSEVDGINEIYRDSERRTWVCGDSGVGYFDKNDTFIQVGGLEIDTYITSMIMDYEGNYWFSSSRMGVLYLGFSKFVDYYMENGIDAAITNCIVQYRGSKYIGTDQGLVITNIKDNIVTNELTERLKGIGIRHIMVDSKGNIWISTFRRYGVVKASPDGTITNYSRYNKILTNMVNCTIELSDGNIAVATEEGISIITPSGELVRNISNDEGLEYSNILTLYEDDNGRLFAGSDGGGLYIIDGDMVTNYTEDDDLTSNVVTTIVEGTKGIWIGTDNGLSLYSENIRQVSNIDYSNNIYDILFEDEDMWIIGSRGVLRTNEDELLGNQGISGRYLTQTDGLDNLITINSWSYIDTNHKLYICTNQGINTLDTESIPVNEAPPRIAVSEIDVDGEIYSFDRLDGELTVSNSVNRITINFGVLSYSNRENIQVQYMLEGFDTEPITIRGNEPMQAVYTNLDGGTYTFTITAINGDGIKCEQNVTFTIDKEMGFFEMRVIRILLVVSGILILAVIVLIVVKFQSAVSGKNKEIEELAKEHEVALKSSSAKTDYLANMSNEIKTPINAIIKEASDMADENPESENYDRIQSIIATGSDIIEKVDDIIYLAKLEADRVVPVNAPYSLTTLICDLSDKVINELGDRPVKFYVELGENIPDIVIGDFEKIKDILERLLENAYKFTKEGSITLSVDCYDFSEDGKESKIENLLFSVSDTGVGIQSERLPNIFDVYNIADNKKASGMGGKGIGLTIAKKLAEMMNGELAAESIYGAGSTFSLSINQLKPDKNIYSGSVDAENIQLVSKEEAEKLWTPDVNALLVDDVEVSRTVAVGVLNQMEMRVDVATSGLSAIDMVMNNKYDIVFMDLSMPVMSGEDTLHEIRELEDDEYKNLPVIAMTEDALIEDRSRILESGFDDVIVKPMEIRALATIIKKHVKHSKVKHKTSNIIQYIRESRYGEGLEALQDNIDVARALEKIGGSTEVYNKIVRTFYNQNLDAVDDITDKFENDYRGFKARIHAIKTGSINIGAYKLSTSASKIEAAVNIGNREYIRVNLYRFKRLLKNLIDSLEEYLEFVDRQSGMTDEEYAAKVYHEQQKKEAEKDILQEKIDCDILRKMQEFIEGQDIDGIKECLNEINVFNYGSEDKDFISVLTEAVEGSDYETMKELVATYINLKM